jgi:hypothetical protein
MTSCDPLRATDRQQVALYHAPTSSSTRSDATDEAEKGAGHSGIRRGLGGRSVLPPQHSARGRLTAAKNLGGRPLTEVIHWKFSRRRGLGIKRQRLPQGKRSRGLGEKYLPGHTDVA